MRQPEGVATMAFVKDRAAQAEPVPAQPPTLAERRFTLERLLYTPAEAAEALGLGQTKVYELLARGSLESIKIGAARRIPRDALERFVAALRTGLDSAAECRTNLL